MQSYTKLQETSLLLLRFIVAAIFIYAGYVKWSFWSAAGLAIIMVGAIFLMQFTMQIGFSTPQGQGWDFPLIILGACIALIAFGAGKWSVDAKRK